MRKIRYSILIAAVLTGICSCQKDRMDVQADGSLTLGFKAAQAFEISASATRGTLGEIAENTITDIRIFAADDQGVLIDALLDDSNCWEDFSETDACAWKRSATGFGEGIIKLDLQRTVEGSLDIYAIANSKSVQLEIPDALQTKDDIRDILVKLSENSVSRNGVLPMTSILKDVSLADPDLLLSFRKLDAKVLVKVVSDNGYEFTVQDWSVSGIPSGTGAFENDTVCTPFDETERKFEGDGFSFYSFPDTAGISITINGSLTRENFWSQVRYTFNLKPKSGTYYTCTVTLSGVNSIRLNVDEESEPVEGYGGELVDVVTGGYFIDADSHYDTRVITISKAVLDEDRSDYSSSISDDSWVHFIFNDFDPDTKTYSTSARPYPGGGSKALICPADLFESLKAGEADNDGNMLLTVFIDEYCYDGNAWNTFANKAPRTMNLLCSRKVNAATGNKVTKAFISIVQQSIQTVYDSKSSTAWGVESVNESEGLPYSEDGSKATGSDGFNNGRLNSFRAWGLTSGTGTEFLSGCTWNSYKARIDSYQRYACMGRNRDENGNGKIDAGELKWYTASTEQLVMLWMGNDVICQGARVDAANPEASFRCVRNFGVSAGNNSNPNLTQLPAAVLTYADNSFAATNINPKALRQSSGRELEQNFEYEESNRISAGFSPAATVRTFSPVGIMKLNAEVTAGRAGNYCPAGYRLPNQKELMLMSYYCPDILQGTVSVCRTLCSDRLPVSAYSWIWDGSLKTADGIVTTTSIRCIKDN